MLLTTRVNRDEQIDMTAKVRVPLLHRLPLTRIS